MSMERGGFGGGHPPLESLWDGQGRSVYAKAGISLLGLLILLISYENGQYFARGYFLHLLPMLLVCGIGWGLLRDARPPGTPTVFWTLSVSAVVCIALELAFHIYKRKAFDENGALTLLSFCLLLLTSFVAFKIWLLRRAPGRLSFRDQGAIWLLIACGFVYLAADEKSLLHEGMDSSFHKMLGIGPNAWTSRLDDLLVGLYGVVGMAALWIYRAEITRYAVCFRLLKIGFVGLFLSVIADAASNRSDFFVAWLGEPVGMAAYHVVGELEEILKVASEVVFLTGFSSALREAMEKGKAAAVPASG